MDTNQNNPVIEYLLELLDSNTTPERALIMLSSPLLSIDKFPKGDNIPVMIFLAFMRFIMRNQLAPNSSVQGIWEKIFIKTLRYSRDLSVSGKEIQQVRQLYAPTLVPAKSSYEGKWIQKVLSTPSNCPNLVIRLELFRLFFMFKNSSNFVSDRLCRTFILTVSKIQPHHIYESEEEMMFGFHEFAKIVYSCYKEESLERRLSKGLEEQFTNCFFNIEEGRMDVYPSSREEITKRILSNGMIVNCDEVRFLCHCIQLLGIYAIKASTISNSLTQIYQIKDICVLFSNIRFILDLSYIPGLSPWEKFQYICSHLPLRPYVVDAIRDITTAIINSKHMGIYKYKVMSIRDNLAENLHIYNKYSELPRLLLVRQVQGPAFARQHALLLNDLKQLYNGNHTLGNSEDIIEAVSSREDNDEEDNSDVDLDEESDEDSSETTDNSETADSNEPTEQFGK